jgi:hypothetical protein
MNIKHARNCIGDDRTLCGFASEGEARDDGDPPPVYAQPGESVTCEDCKRVINHVRQSIRRASYVVNP